MQGPFVIGTFILQTVFCTISGLSLHPSSDLVIQNFSIVCDFDGANWTSLLQFFSDGRSAGGCIQPPSLTCFSTIGNITRQSTQSVTLTLNNASNILTYGTALWQCTHAGLPTGEYNASVIAVCSDETVEQNGDRVDIRCTCGFPSVKATIKYKMSGGSKDPKVVDLQSSTGNSCIDDPRAMNFSYKEDISPGIEELCVSFTTMSQISESKEICRSIACTGSFHCGFWLLLLVVVTSIIILILMWRKVKRFGFSASGFSNMKIGITAVFSVVAIGTGIGLGLGLREGQANCLECEATVGISIALGVILSVGQFILFICCCKEKGCDGNSEGETSDRSNGDRARTPASATGINLEAKKKSQNKPTEKGTEASSLTSKSFGYPLPGTPNTRKNQLEPLKTDSFEVENPSTERKKKKKRKKKKETSEGNEASEEKEERPELEF